jgi:hypothetical protein
LKRIRKSKSKRWSLKDYLTTLGPLLRPRAVFGSLADSGDSKEVVRGADLAVKELQGLYTAVAGSKPFSLSRELKPPLEVMSSTLELTPVEYASGSAPRSGPVPDLCPNDRLTRPDG